MQFDVRNRFSRQKFKSIKVQVGDSLLKMLGEGAEYMFGTLGRRAGPEMEKTITQLLQIYYEAKHI